MSGAAREIMLEFADRTGLSRAVRTPSRYLWTDAHAVCNFLSLYRLSGDEHFESLAIKLIDQVHHVLGRHRDDDARTGWISGLSEAEGEAHPTAGGLRIGKPLNERAIDDAFDEHLEWERDGQYFHYSTKWMHALCRAAVVLDEEKYCRWAVELAKATHAGFHTADFVARQKRLHWKMSIDLSYPLVAASGMHDPLDGLVTYHEIEDCVRLFPDLHWPYDLDTEIAEAEAMIEAGRWETNDALGIGGLLFDASRALQLALRNRDLMTTARRLVSASLNSLEAYLRRTDLRVPAEYRLAFRELGMTIGLHAVETMERLCAENVCDCGAAMRDEINDLFRFAMHASTIEDFWREPRNHKVRSWQDHHDINDVMLATSLLPDEFLAVGQLPHLGAPAGPPAAEWSHFEHDADIGLHASAATRAELFEGLATALTAVVTDPQGIDCHQSVEVHCEAPNDELLLVDWLNAIVFEMATRGMVFGHFDVLLHDGKLDGRLDGERLERERHQPAVEVKGATYTALQVKKDKSGLWTGQCIVDV